jgi:hypothetical protein
MRDQASDRGRRSAPPQPRYTLLFRNGERLRHQDPLTAAQFCADARLLQVQPEPLPGNA